MAEADVARPWQKGGEHLAHRRDVAHARISHRDARRARLRTWRRALAQVPRLLRGEAQREVPRDCAGTGKGGLSFRLRRRQPRLRTRAPHALQ